MLIRSTVFTYIIISLTIGSQITFAQTQMKGSEDGKNQVKVMILGTYHFDNPNRDVIKITGPDVLSKTYQKQIKEVVDSLAKFGPTKIAVEAMPEEKPRVDSLYKRYVSEKYELASSELQQIGFRLGKRFDHPKLYSIDHHGSFPFKKVYQYAKQHHPSFINDFEKIRSKVKQLNDSLFQHASIPQILRQKNSSSSLALQRDLYAQIASVGNDTTFIGANLVSNWHRRNIKIFGDLARIAEPEDRILVIFGAGHAPLLRYFVKSSRRMEFIDPLDYL